MFQHMFCCRDAPGRMYITNPLTDNTVWCLHPISGCCCSFIQALCWISSCISVISALSAIWAPNMLCWLCTYLFSMFIILSFLWKLIVILWWKVEGNEKEWTLRPQLMLEGLLRSDKKTSKDFLQKESDSFSCVSLLLFVIWSSVMSQIFVNCGVCVSVWFSTLSDIVEGFAHYLWAASQEKLWERSCCHPASRRSRSWEACSNYYWHRTKSSSSNSWERTSIHWSSEAAQ